jgi:hypothetical protein
VKHLSNLFSLLALLTLGSARLAAQATDPFPAVDENQYANSMVITGQVRMNGKVLTKADDVIVAVYQGDELRGKDVLLDTGSYSDLFMVMVYGDTNGEPLTFKVHTNGSIFEVDQQLLYTINARIGKASDPYYIDLSSNDVPTSIATTPEKSADTPAYNIQGYRTLPLMKGIVIKNNRKYLNK